MLVVVLPVPPFCEAIETIIDQSMHYKPSMGFLGHFETGLSIAEFLFSCQEAN